MSFDFSAIFWDDEPEVHNDDDDFDNADDDDDDDVDDDEQDEDTRGSFASHGTSTPERGIKPRLSSS